ncbi:MAG: dipeptidase [Polyangiales bacterium]
MALLAACEDEPSVEEAPTPAAPSVAIAPEEPATAPEEPATVEAEPGAEVELPMLALDTHVDTPQRMLDDGDDPIERLTGGHLDIPRMREGGLTGAFFSVYVSPRKFEGEAAWERALALTRAIREFTERHPDETILCLSGDDVRRAQREGKIAVLMGVEGAQALGTDQPRLALSRIRELYDLGNRYMTITWSVDNPLGHSSLGENPEGGLTPLGRRAVRLMNRLGMIVDISHVSDQTFWDTMDVATKPVLASHSSARALADIPRNMSDAMIRRVGAQGGAVCLNFFTQFIDREYRLRRRRLEWRNRDAFGALGEFESWVERGRAEFALARELDDELNAPTLGTLADHIEHVVEIAGHGAACLGSDYDGVPELPVGMEDVSDLPALRSVLEERGLPVAEVFGLNVLRVLDANTPDPADE